MSNTYEFLMSCWGGGATKGIQCARVRFLDENNNNVAINAKATSADPRGWNNDELWFSTNLTAGSNTTHVTIRSKLNLYGQLFPNNSVMHPSNLPIYVYADELQNNLICILETRTNFDNYTHSNGNTYEQPCVYDSDTNTFEDTVQLQYKKDLPDEGNPNPKAEFTTSESGPVGRSRGPDDYDIDVDEVGGTSISDLDSDVSKLKEYATGQKPTMKELVQNIKRKDKANRITTDTEAQSDAIIRRQGEMLNYDPEPDFASGGLAGMLGE